MIRGVIVSLHVATGGAVGALVRSRPLALLLGPALLLLFAAMARHPALAAGLTRFLTRPLVRRPFLVSGLAALAGDLALFVSIHRSKSAIFLGHRCLLAYTNSVRANTRAATDMPRGGRKSNEYNGLGKTFSAPPTPRVQP